MTAHALFAFTRHLQPITYRLLPLRATEGHPCLTALAVPGFGQVGADLL